jgi:hypothetical protein
LSEAREFWWATYVLTELLLLPSLVFPSLFRPVGPLWAFNQLLQNLVGLLPIRFRLHPMDTAVLLAVVLPIVIQSLVMSAGCAWGQLRYQIRDYRVCAIVGFYTAPLMWSSVAIVLFGMLLSTDLFDPHSWRTDLITFEPLKISLNASELLTIAIVLLLVLALAFWWVRLCAALRAVRYANV